MRSTGWTSPRPIRRPHTRLTAARASNGLSRVTASASACLREKRGSAGTAGRCLSLGGTTRYQSCLLRLFLQVREAHEPADGRLGQARTGLGIDVLRAIEGRDHPPVMGLLDLARDHVVVALGALDLHPEDQRSHRLGHGLRVVLPLVEELNQPPLLGPR